MSRTKRLWRSGFQLVSGAFTALHSEAEFPVERIARDGVRRISRRLVEGERQRALSELMAFLTTSGFNGGPWSVRVEEGEPADVHIASCLVAARRPARDGHAWPIRLAQDIDRQRNRTGATHLER